MGIVVLLAWLTLFGLFLWSAWLTMRINDRLRDFHPEVWRRLNSSRSHWERSISRSRFYFGEESSVLGDQELVQATKTLKSIRARYFICFALLVVSFVLLRWHAA